MAQAAGETSEPTAQHRGITPERFAAVHRALLSGLLGNVGFKKEQFEYNGTRGRKFHLFPGSSLFSRKPPWVMSAELTETTKLYARTVARIEPEWIENVGEHLLHKEYSEPYYHRESAHVLASEKVSLFGLVVVPRRRVHYGPIDPKASRDIFIRQGLVEGEYHSEAPWARNNRQLIRDVELAEAKLRRRDLLVDAQSRFAFYDVRVPAGIYNGPLFEKWRQKAEQADRRALFMKREDLIVPGPEAPAELFPERVVVNDSVRITLGYVFDPGNEFDGVTATVPVALLNQLPQEPFDWLVPGHLAEKLTELIRTMPKDVRVQFVPVPDTVKSVLPLIRFGDGSLYEQLAWQLGKFAGKAISPQAFCSDYLPDYLRMNFRIVDEVGKTLAIGRDLETIRRKLRVELKQTFEELPKSQWHRDGITRWDFDDLPEMVEIKRPGMVVRGYPAIVEKDGDKASPGGSVGLRLLDSAELAARANLVGLRRLFLLQLGGDRVKHLQRHLPGIDRMSLQYATLGPSEELKRDLLNLSADRALFGEAQVVIRKREDFVTRAETAWQRLSESSRDICEAVGQSLELYQSLSRRLGQPVPPLLATNTNDIREHLKALLPRGFVASTPWPWLKHFPRYLKALDLRLTKLLNAGANRDTQAMSQVRPLWKKYVDRAELHEFQGVSDPNLSQYRWLLEELRVSLFAQELKTAFPVSVKRLEQLFAEVK
ncbi:DUF3418 domain-containing protein [Humisphaera borealis]|uniref:DUF3418 domain-containing protein n=1 Tax=Humisphaera borealis TaxID=2807512 RepID=A0A7M2X0G0_9BACT|nr:DUF3418 domain-containing protein [Humisphaera borealis]QOV91144.1 DUF3418 domain-containing protein [Humisphaera borealis]